MRKIIKKITVVCLMAAITLTLITACGQGGLPTASEQEGLLEVIYASNEDQELFYTTRQVALAQATEMMETLSIAGMTIALVDIDNDFTWLEGLGYADAVNLVPVTENTLFSIGSIGKTFTAVAVMQLVEAGKLDLDEPIVTYLPEFSMLPHPRHGGDYKNITARMLLSHVSGVGEFQRDEFVSTEGQDRDFMNRLLPTLANLHMQNEEVNRITYNNNGYTLLGILAASLVGSENYFDDFVNFTLENIFIPAGMSSSSFEINEYNRGYIALSHDDAQTPSEDFLYVSATPAGGIVSSAHDMSRFMHIMLNGGAMGNTGESRILSQESVQAMAQIQDFGIEFPSPTQMGLGLVHFTLPDGAVLIGHDGSLQHNSMMILDFDNGVGVFVSANSITARAAALPLADIIWRSAVAEKTGEVFPYVSMDADIDVYEPVAISLSSEELQQFVGFYSMFGELVLSEDGVLHFPQFPGLPVPFELTPMSDGTFDTVHGRLQFREIGETMIITTAASALIPETPVTMLAERVDDITEAGSEFEQWVGTYRIVDMEEVEIRIGINESGLAYLYQSGSESLIDKVDEYTFFIPGRSRGLGEIIKFSWDGDTAMFTLSGYTLVRI